MTSADTTRSSPRSSPLSPPQGMYASAHNVTVYTAILRTNRLLVRLEGAACASMHRKHRKVVPSCTRRRNSPWRSSASKNVYRYQHSRMKQRVWRQCARSHRVFESNFFPGRKFLATCQRARGTRGRQAHVCCACGAEQAKQNRKPTF